MAIRCDEIRGRLIVYARNQASEVLGKALKVTHADQLAMVRIGEGTLEV